MVTSFILLAATNNGNINNIAVFAAVFSAVFAGFSAIVARAALSGTKKALLHEAILNLFKDYRSFEMFYAIKELSEFYDIHKDKLVDEYMKKYNEDKKSFLRLSGNVRREGEQNSLHYLRRLVSHFYQELGALYINEIFPKKIITDTWSVGELRIIPEILIPIENKLRKDLHNLKPLKDGDPLIELNKLYDCMLSQESKP